MESSPILWYILIALPACLNMWAIWHAFYHKFSSQGQRMLWICAAVFLPVIGGLAYLLIGRAQAGERL